MEHEEGCMHSVTSSEAQFNGPFETVCMSRKCSIWFDLKTWFGYKSKSLSIDMFREYFHDIAHGGEGAYEKLILHGTKAIQECVQIDLFDCQDAVDLHVISKQIFPHLPQKISYELALYFWTHKNSEISTTDTSLSIFADNYLHGGQNLINNRTKANYVKVCFSFAYQAIAGEHHYEKLETWLPCFIKHITTAHKHEHLSSQAENQLLLDLETYLGYKYDYITPRIHECLSLPFDKVASLSDINRGREMLKFSCRLYFNAIEMLKSHGPMDEIDLNEKVELMLGSGPLEVFSIFYMNLNKITSHNLSIVPGQVGIKNAKFIFERLVGACCCTIKKDSETIFNIDSDQVKQKFATMAKLVQRLHQIQMAIQFFQKKTQPVLPINNTTTFQRGIDKSVGTTPDATSIFAGMDIGNVKIISNNQSKTLGFIHNFKNLIDSYENFNPIQDSICCKMMEMSSAPK